MRWSPRRVTFLAIANAMMLALAFGLGELAMRWHVEGGLGGAWRSFFGAGGTPSASIQLVPDDLLGFKPNPARPDVNALGLLHAELPEVKPEHLFRVIVLGDSVAADGGSFVALLQQRIGQLRPGATEVINAAVQGYTTYQQRRLFERDLMVLRPDLVLLQYCTNDNHAFLHMLNGRGRWLVTPAAERALVPDGLGPLAAMMRSSYLLLELRVRLFAMGSIAGDRFPWDRDPGFAAAWQDRTWADVERHLAAIRDRARQTGARFGIVAVPLEAQLQQTWLDRDRHYTVKPQRHLADISGRLDVPFLDLHPAFLARRDERLYRDGIHLSPAGHEVAAQHLLRFLGETGLVE